MKQSLQSWKEHHMQRLSFAQVHQAIMHNLQRVPQLEVQVIKLCQSVRWKPTLQNQLPKNKEEELERSLCPTCIYTCCQFCHKEADTAKSRAGVGPVLDQPHSAAQSLSYTNTTSFMKGWAPRMDQPQSLHLAFVLTLAKYSNITHACGLLLHAGVGPVLDQLHSAAQCRSYTNATSFINSEDAER